MMMKDMCKWILVASLVLSSADSADWKSKFFRSKNADASSAAGAGASAPSADQVMAFDEDRYEGLHQQRNLVDRPTHPDTGYEYDIMAENLDASLKELDSLLGDLASNVEFLNEKIPFLGKSFNDLVSAGSTINAILDLTGFPTDGQTEVYYNISDLTDDLTVFAETVADGVLGAISAEASSALPNCASGEGPLDISANADHTELTITFCTSLSFTAGLGQGRDITFDFDGLFEAIPDSIELETDATIDVTAALHFGASMTMNINSGTVVSVDLEPVVGELTIDGEALFTAAYGMVDLEFTADVTAAASATLIYCTDTLEDEDTTCPSVDVGDATRAGTTNFFFDKSASYELDGAVTIDPANFPGLDLSLGATANILEDNLFDPAPVVTATGFDYEDFLKFSPANAVLMLRVLDSFLVRAQENEAFAIK